ncbi:MAG: hypothetical protein K8R99_02530 [Actinomycetia bacterium]|nr:hypothetical protein [Actinomycetes bacterium]
MPFVDMTAADTTTDRRAGDSSLPFPEQRPDGYVSYAPTRAFMPDRYFFALAVIHAMRCASSAVALLAAAEAGNGFAILALSATLAASHAALVVGCHLQRRWAKVGSILLDVQASFMTIIVLVALSDFDLSWSAMVRQVVGPSITIWLAIKARVERRRRVTTTATGLALNS